MINKLASLPLLILLCLASQSPAQDSSLSKETLSHYSGPSILRFADFLWNRGDFRRAAVEYQRYLHTNVEYNEPGVYYQLGRCYLRSSVHKEATPYFIRAAGLVERPTFRDTVLAALASTYFLTNSNEFLAAADTMQTYDSTGFLRQHLLALKALFYLKHQNWQDALQTLSDAQPAAKKEGSGKSITTLIQLVERGKSLPKKSPLVAGFMSTFIPGSGKIYVDRIVEGMYSLILIAGSSWLAYEGFHDNGISSLKGWLFGSTATVFHLGNIYGSVVAARFYNSRFEEHLANDIQTHIVFRTHF